MKKRNNPILIYAEIKKNFFVLLSKGFSSRNNKKKMERITLSENPMSDVQHDKEYEKFYTNTTRWQTI